MWNGPSRRIPVSHDAQAADSSATWRQVQVTVTAAQAGAVVIGPVEQQLGDGGHRARR